MTQTSILVARIVTLGRRNQIARDLSWDGGRIEVTELHFRNELAISHTLSDRLRETPRFIRTVFWLILHESYHI